MSMNVKVKHPDAVFGQDTPDALAAFVDALRTTDPSAMPPTQRVTLADGVALAAKRLVAEYDRLTKLMEETNAKATATAAALADIEAREKAVSAREALVGLHLPHAANVAPLRQGLLRRVWKYLVQRRTKVVQQDARPVLGADAERPEPFRAAHRG